MTSEELADRLINFAARVGNVVDALPDTRMGRHIGGQLVRSGTSPAPNYEEACAAESRADFSHKLSICLKELRESRCWIRLIIRRRCCRNIGWANCLMNAISSAISSGSQLLRPRLISRRQCQLRRHDLRIFQFALFNF